MDPVAKCIRDANPEGPAKADDHTEGTESFCFEVDIPARLATIFEPRS